MTRVKGKFGEGESGNPNGRPKKGRALTELLERAGNQRIAQGPGLDTKAARKKILAVTVWKLLTEGSAILPNGETIKIGPKEYVQLTQWLYNHIDGPAKVEYDLTSMGQALSFKVYAGIDTDEV